MEPLHEPRHGKTRLARSPGLAHRRALAVSTFVVFAPALDCDFVNLDDPDYVTRNEIVKAGLTRRSSLGADYLRLRELASVDVVVPRTGRLLLAKARLGRAGSPGLSPDQRPLAFGQCSTFCSWRCGRLPAAGQAPAAAALFAVHPLRVESVAWVAERKDVLSTFFGILALRAYAGYSCRPSPLRYLGVAGAFVLSLMCKPMLVTLPCLLLVLDWWPLRRARTPRDCGRLLAEKCPLFRRWLPPFPSRCSTSSREAGR